MDIAKRNISPRVFIILSLTFFGFLLSCSPKHNDNLDNPNKIQVFNLDQELITVGYDKYLDLPAPEIRQSNMHGWDYYLCQEENCRCIHGSEPFLMVRPGKESDKTVFWLAGGGACWPGRNDCTKEPIFYQSYIEIGLGSKDSQNPVRDWNIVYLPYCDGSMHLGDNSVDTDGDGNIDQYYWGFRNTSAAVSLTRKLFPNTQQILLSGCSSGGAGTIGTAPILRSAFPTADLFVLNISGSALIPTDREQDRTLALEAWKLDTLIPPDCPECKDQFIYLYNWLLERDDQLHIGFFSSYQDINARTLWGLSPQDFQNLLLETTGKIQAEHPESFQRFIIDGEIHCATDYSYSIDDISLWQWIDWMIADDSRWRDMLE